MARTKSVHLIFKSIACQVFLQKPKVYFSYYSHISHILTKFVSQI